MSDPAPRVVEWVKCAVCGEPFKTAQGRAGHLRLATDARHAEFLRAQQAKRAMPSASPQAPRESAPPARAPEPHPAPAQAPRTAERASPQAGGRAERPAQAPQPAPRAPERPPAPAKAEPARVLERVPTPSPSAPARAEQPAPKPAQAAPTPAVQPEEPRAPKTAPAAKAPEAPAPTAPAPVEPAPGEDWAFSDDPDHAPTVAPGHYPGSTLEDTGTFEEPAPAEEKPGGPPLLGLLGGLAGLVLLVKSLQGAKARNPREPAGVPGDQPASVPTPQETQDLVDNGWPADAMSGGVRNRHHFDGPDGPRRGWGL